MVTMVLNREGLEHSRTCLDIVNCDFMFLRSCGKRPQKSKTQQLRQLGKNPKLYRIWIRINPIHIQHIQHLSCAQKRGSRRLLIQFDEVP